MDTPLPPSDHPGGVLPWGPGWVHRDVAALLVTEDGRYLMQLRDDFSWLRVAGHWGLFGGRVEAGETPREALFRELREELEFTPTVARWFIETASVIPQLGVPPSQKTFFEVPVTPAEVECLPLHEGRAKRLFTLDDLLREPRLVPWDLEGLMIHARRDAVLRRPTDVD